MKMIPNPGRALARSYAMWCVYLSGLLQLLPAIVPYVAGYIPPWASLVLMLLAPLGYVIAQPSIRNREAADAADQ